MHKLIGLLCILGLSGIAYGYDVTQGALQNDPSLSGYGYNVNGYGNTAGSSSAKVNVIRLKDNWGAISGSMQQPYLDSANNMDSKKNARKIALERCEKATGSSCRILLVYKNGCATVADGLISDTTKNIHQAFGAGGDTPKQAEQAALNACERGGGGNCRIVMPTECSFAKKP